MRRWQTLLLGGSLLAAACAPVASTPAPQALTPATLLIPLPLPEEECEWVRQGHTEHWDNALEDRCVVDEVTWDIIGCESGGFDIEAYLTSECKEEEEFPDGYIHQGIALVDTAVVECDGEDPEKSTCRTIVTCSEDPEHPLCAPSPLRPGRCGMLPWDAPTPVVRVFVAVMSPRHLCARAVNGMDARIDHGAAPFTLDRWETDRWQRVLPEKGGSVPWAPQSLWYKGFTEQGLWYPAERPIPGRYRVCFRYWEHGETEEQQQQACSPPFFLAIE